jgi:hypothetical protein
MLPLSYGQQSSSEAASKATPLCVSAAVDATFAFHDQPAGEQTVSLYFVNNGDIACRLKDPPNPSFAVDGHSMNVPFCPFCGPDGKSVPMWNRRPENEVVLAPGASAAIDINWAVTGDSCQWADWASIFFNWSDGSAPRKFTNFLFIPSDWPLHICSPVRSFGYRSAVNSPSNGGRKDPALRISLLQKTVYSDERATLHVELAGSAQSREKGKPSGVPLRTTCASLYTVRQTRFEPLHTLDSFQGESYTPEQIREDKERAWPQWKRGGRRGCDVLAGTLSADAEIAARDLATVTHIEWRTAPLGNDPIFFTAATHFTVLDVDTLAPNWGETAQGIRAGLSVDRVKFAVGERVPLHIRWEDSNATVSLGQGECREPLPDVEIQNSEHQVLKTLPTYQGCSGHGWGPFSIGKGTAQHEFREFTTKSPASPPFVTPTPPDLPGPGVYYLVSVWSPRVLDTSETESDGIRIGAGRLGEVYATARSLPIRVEIVPSTNPRNHVR